VGEKETAICRTRGVQRVTGKVSEGRRGGASDSGPKVRVEKTQPEPGEERKAAVKRGNEQGKGACHICN